MGPYCRFCNQRCFTHMPVGTPPEILAAYGTSTIIATCPGGQQFEKQKVGYCYDDIKQAIDVQPIAVDPIELQVRKDIEQLAKSERGRGAMGDLLRLLENDGLSLDQFNQAALMDLLLIAFGNKPGTVLGALRVAAAPLTRKAV